LCGPKLLTENFTVTKNIDDFFLQGPKCGIYFFRN